MDRGGACVTPLAACSLHAELTVLFMRAGGRLGTAGKIVIHSVSSSATPTKRERDMQRTSSARSYRSPYWTFSLLAVAIVLIVVLPLTLWLQWSWLWAWLTGINVATFVLYGYDKAVAGGGRRVPETVLHGAELLGGTPAAFVAQRLFHHKTVKGSYQRRFWLIVAVQVVVVGIRWWIGRP